MRKKLLNSKGFSLMEALVVIGVLAIIGYLMTDLLARTLKGGNKTELNNIIKQNGERALSVMDQTIRASDQVVCISGGGDTIAVIKNGTFNRFRFVAPTSSANGYISQDTFVLSDPTQTTTICTDSQVSPAPLTNQDLVTGVSLKSGVFSRMQNAGFKDVVNVSFNLSPSINAGTGADSSVGTNNQINFSTTVVLR